ncbi:MAG: hypothetical protein OEM93_21215 [Rhodospirillales bacterium]|nr:hypothetical protein [Rhodospirillales bacterium]MDH3917425.1 hypothetical protein [Rhodospirillales bacterium]MDH3970237.1 hypothetical protein [Rhodospirillales bacterium]
MDITRLLVFMAALLTCSMPCAGETISPSAKLRFTLEPKQKETIFQETSKFAAENDFSFEDAGIHLPLLEGRRLVYIRLKRDDHIEIHINNVHAEESYFIGIYERKPAPGWREVWDDLIAMFRARCLIGLEDLAGDGRDYEPVEAN